MFYEETPVKQKDNKKRGELVHRNKDEIAEDICTVINDKKLRYGTKYYCIHNAIWVWTELDGKFEGNSKKKKGCPYWSEGALKFVREIQENRSAISKNLVHEHIVPRIVLIDKILGNSPEGGWTTDKVKTLFEKFCIGVVVTKGEDEKLKSHIKSMPENWDGEDCWARYRNKITVFKPESVRWIKKKIEITKQGAPLF